jgi:ribonuclease P protein component
MAEFRRHHRILQAGQFNAVFANLKRLHGRFFSLHLLVNEVDHHRLGLAVSRKVSKRAVDRNRIKRQVRDAFRHFQARDSAGKDKGNKLDMVIVAKPPAADADTQLLRRELEKMWTKAVNDANSTD